MSIKVALIYGSAREGRFCDKVAGWAAQELAIRSEFAVDVIDPAQEDVTNLAALRDHGPTPLHRRSFAPVAAAYARITGGDASAAIQLDLQGMDGKNLQQSAR